MKLTENRLRTIINRVLQEARTQGNLSNHTTMIGSKALKPLSEDMYTERVRYCLDYIDKFEARGWKIIDFVIGLDDTWKDGFIRIHFKVDCTYSVVHVRLAIGLGEFESFDASINSKLKPAVVEVPTGLYDHTVKMNLANYYIGDSLFTTGGYYNFSTSGRNYYLYWEDALKWICNLSEIPPQERPFKDEKTKNSREGKMLKATYGNVTDKQFRNRPEFRG